jgi:hypothetical protein
LLVLANLARDRICQNRKHFVGVLLVFANNRLGRALTMVLLLLVCINPAFVIPECHAQGLGQRTWDFNHTWVFSVGVLKWQDKGLSSFTTKDRRDATIVDTFRADGVPENHIVYLSDTEATLREIRTQLSALLRKTAPGDTLFFYYCGHGWISTEDNKTGVFANYDAGNSLSSCWSTTSIANDLARQFHGSTLICAVDCCHSGSLANAITAAKPGFNYAVLTSTSADRKSTANWTFSQSVLDCLRGHRYADENSDGVITMSELGNYIQQEMSKFENQPAIVAENAGFNPSFQFGTDKFGDEMIPERVQVLWGKKWWPAKMFETDGNRAKVHWVSIGYDSTANDQWVDLNTVKFLERGAGASLPAVSNYKVGANVQVLWKNKYYPATITNANGTQYFIHYDGYGNDWDEWITADRIK